MRITNTTILQLWRRSPIILEFQSDSKFREIQWNHLVWNVMGQENLLYLSESVIYPLHGGRNNSRQHNNPKNVASDLRRTRL